MNASTAFRSLLVLSTLALILWACDFGFGKANPNQGVDVAVPSPDAGSTFTAESGLPEDRIYAVASCPNGNVWAGFGQQAGGVARYNGSNWKTFTEEDGLESDRVYALACDQQNGVWIGYGIQGQGVTRRSGNEWTTYTEEDGLSSNYVATITSEKDGDLWIGYAEQQEGVDRFK